MSNIYDYSYDDLHADVAAIADQVTKSDFNPDIIIGVVRGGAIPGVYLSHTLGLPLKTIEWQTRDGGDREHRYDIIDIDIGEDDLKVLIVDDINDSGLTFTQILDDFKYFDPTKIDTHVRTAALITKPTSSHTVDFYGRIEEDNRWIHYPWEKK